MLSSDLLWRENYTLISIEQTSDKDCVGQFSIRFIWGKPF